MRHLVIACVVAGMTLAAGLTEALAKRVALVIGNDDYEHVADLKKAVNDGRTISELLEKVGYDVVFATNVSRRGFNRNLQKAVSKLEAGDEALFFFAGHGVEIDGRNYLLPTDIPSAQPGQESLVKGEAIAVDDVLEELQGRKPSVSVLILDACRDNPFKAYGRSVGGTRGFARIAAPSGTFIMYSAGVGQTALDRLSDDDPNPNSVYTRTLVPLLARPGYSLPNIAREVRRQVERLAGTMQHLQRPAYYDELTGDYYLVAPKEKQDRPSDIKEPDFKTTLIVPRITKKPAFTGKSTNACDQMAADPFDDRAVADGVTYPALAKNSLKAIRACRKALADAPDSARYAFQLGRSLDAEKRYEDAREQFEKAASKNYAAAQTYLGYYYEFTDSGARNYDKALELYQAAAAQGNVPAIHQLGSMYRLGRGTEKDLEEAFKWSMKAAEAEFGLAMNAVGYSYDNGLGVKQDFAQARRWYQRAAEVGNYTAMDNLGYMHEHGRGVDKNPDEALRWYRRSAEKGVASGLYKVGYFYSNGLAVAKDRNEALKWYRKAANAGSTAAMVELGGAYFYGGLIPKDPDAGLKWLRKASDKGDFDAMWRLASIYMSDRGGYKNLSKGIALFKKAADAGYAPAQSQLGYYYDNGIGVTQDFSKARELYEKAAAKGQKNAIHNLGYMYAYARGVERDYGKARKLFYKAARKGNTVAMRELADLYYTGADGQKDLAEARKWHRKAADLGDANAMNRTGNFFASGEGGEKDLIQARRWYEKSARKGFNWGMLNFAINLFNTKEYRAAYPWFKKAAGTNLPDALRWYGLFLDFTAAGYSNPPLAAQYMFRAIRTGNRTALDEMLRFSHGRTPQFRRELQKLLRQEGLYRGRIDGSFGPSTLQAVRTLGRGEAPQRMDIIRDGAR